MDIKRIAYLMYILVIIIHAIIMSAINVKTFSAVYVASLLCLITAYLCGMAEGGAFD